MNTTAEDGYYVYGLIDPETRRRTKDDLQSVFYVGKGQLLRWRDHARDVRRVLEQEELALERRGSKAERIHRILDRGELVRAIRLSGGYVDSQDAERAEALAIDLMQGLLSAHKLDPLTNSKPGYHAGFIDLGDHFRFVTTADVDVPDLPAGTPSTIVVKGSTDMLPAGGHQVVTGALLGSGFDDHAARIKVLEAAPTGTFTFDRRGWDPEDPWDDDEARERARRYWRFGRDRVLGWFDDAESMPTTLLLSIRTRGQTVVRYAWAIDVDGVWEYHPDGSYWGVPLGRRLYRHTALGRALHEDRDGRRVPILLNRSAGWHVLSIPM